MLLTATSKRNVMFCLIHHINDSEVKVRKEIEIKNNKQHKTLSDNKKGHITSRIKSFV